MGQALQCYDFADTPNVNDKAYQSAGSVVTAGYALLLNSNSSEDINASDAEDVVKAVALLDSAKAFIAVFLNG